MHEDSGPTINLKNINYINQVEKYTNACNKDVRIGKLDSANEKNTKKDKKLSTTNSQEKQYKEGNPASEKAYFEKHVYMMRDKMVEMFKNCERIPAKDKRAIEKEFRNEMKELKKSLGDIKSIRKKLFADNNEKYITIEKINEEIRVIFIYLKNL
jgi:hypothetical protein